MPRRSARPPLRDLGAAAPRPRGALAAAAALGAAGLGLGAALLRPRDHGAPHAPYFAALNAELRRAGPGRPVLLLDLDALDANLAAVKAAVAPGMALRVVAKSLPSIPLLQHAMAALGTTRVMVFDESVALLASALPEADLLLGKPLPVQAVAAFFAQGGALAGARVQWLVDSAERLAQYAALARTLGVELRVSVEIDVGLHRGGIATPAELGALLRAIAAEPRHLRFTGLMGYEPHVVSAPPLLSSLDRAMAGVVARYEAFNEQVRAHDPAWLGAAVRNGGGSKTYALHRAGGPVSEVALGSCLVKPTDFDVTTLTAHSPALFIATPVLKRLAGIRVPFVEWASAPWSAWDRNRAVSYFVFGGGWLASPVSPAGLVSNPLYGFSTNQALLNGSARTALQPDDWVFLRPRQSERVMQQFGAIRLLRGRRIEGTWPALPFSP